MLPSSHHANGHYDNDPYGAECYLSADIVPPLDYSHNSFISALHGPNGNNEYSAYVRDIEPEATIPTELCERFIFTENSMIDCYPTLVKKSLL